MFNRNHSSHDDAGTNRTTPLRGKQINFDKFALKRRVKELAGYPKTKEISAMDPFWL
jgi:hypothetical protein